MLYHDENSGFIIERFWPEEFELIHYDSWSDWSWSDEIWVFQKGDKVFINEDSDWNPYEVTPDEALAMMMDFDKSGAP